MAKLIKNADGSVSYTFDDANEQDVIRKKSRQAKLDAKSAKDKNKGKSFKDLNPQDKDALLEILLRLHDLL